MHERQQDTMTYVRKYGHPDLFITIWPEIKSNLLPGQKPEDQVFKLKLKKKKKKKTIEMLKTEMIFGRPCARLEFQNIVCHMPIPWCGYLAFVVVKPITSFTIIC